MQKSQERNEGQGGVGEVAVRISVNILGKVKKYPMDRIAELFVVAQFSFVI